MFKCDAIKEISLPAVGGMKHINANLPRLLQKLYPLHSARIDVGYENIWKFTPSALAAVLYTNYPHLNVTDNATKFDFLTHPCKHVTGTRNSIYAVLFKLFSFLTLDCDFNYDSM